jgi:hypothetical protein
MTSRILKTGFTAAPKTPKPAPPPPPKRRSSLPWVLGIIVVLAVAIVILQKSGTLERFFPGGTPASTDLETK